MTSAGFFKLALEAVFDALSVSLANLTIAASQADSVTVLLGGKFCLGEGLVAIAAAFPPVAGIVLPVALMPALVLARIQGLQVAQFVVGAVSVDVMDLMATWDRAVGAMPDMAMFGDDRPVVHRKVDVAVGTEPAVFDAMLFHAREIGACR